MPLEEKMEQSAKDMPKDTIAKPVFESPRELQKVREKLGLDLAVGSERN